MHGRVPGKLVMEPIMSEAMEQPDCRSCGAPLSDTVLDLGAQPLANKLLDSLDEAEHELRFPLQLKVCPSCSLMQLGHTVPPDALFSEYLYFSSVSDAMLRHARSAAENHKRDYALGEKSFVVEIASNDGYLLKNFVQAGIPCLGVEPARNIAEVAEASGIPTLREFFTADVARKLRAERGPVDLILGNNVFAHVPNTNDFVKGLSHLLAARGRVILEFPWAQELIKKLEFDTIYHEHFFYFHAQALVPLFSRHGLEMVRIDRLPIHGGSLRVHVAHRGAAAPDFSVGQVLADEKSAGVGTSEYYTAFGGMVEMLKSELAAEIAAVKQSGRRLAAYGASAKGSTLLNYCGVGRNECDFVADRSVHKQGKFTPGTHLPIFNASSLKEKSPDVTLLLAWNFAEEIVAQQTTYLASGGRFLVPVPRPHYLP